MLLTSPDGRVVDVDDAYWIQRHQSEGYRQATKEEADQYRARKELAVAESQKANEEAGGVYFSSVSPGPDGYGMSRDILKRELFAIGVHLEEQFANQKVGLLYSHPYSVMQMQNDVRLVMTMFESDKIPEEWPDYLNMAEEVIVPSKWCAKVFKESGIDATVVPLGYNARSFTYVDRPVPLDSDTDFTFIHYGSFNVRKGFWEVFEAFNEEFSEDEPVKLILKTVADKPPVPVIPSQYPNIEVVKGQMSEVNLVNLLATCHCMIYPSRGEGFGITPLEAMATGMPAIVPNAHGISEYFHKDYMLEVKVDGKCPAMYYKYKGQDTGEMVVCDVADLRKQMRYAYNNQAKMKLLGKSASEYVKQFTYQETAKKLASVIHKWQGKEVIKRNDSKFLRVDRV